MLDPRSFATSRPADWVEHSLRMDPTVPDLPGAILALAAINHPDLPPESGPDVAAWLMTWLGAQASGGEPLPVIAIKHLSTAVRTHPDWFTDEQRSFVLVSLAGV